MSHTLRLSLYEITVCFGLTGHGGGGLFLWAQVELIELNLFFLFHISCMLSRWNWHLSFCLLNYWQSFLNTHNCQKRIITVLMPFGSKIRVNLLHKQSYKLQIIFRISINLFPDLLWKACCSTVKAIIPTSATRTQWLSHKSKAPGKKKNHYFCSCS